MPPEPFNGQKTCPACSGPLGASPIQVETIGSTSSKQSIWAKLFGYQEKKICIYVCGEECAKEVKADPAHNLVKVINERAGHGSK